MLVDEKILKELATEDGHMGKILFAKEINCLSRREGTIEILKEIGEKNIIHVGCTGHLHNIEKQLENGTHFHKMLMENFGNVIGVDINGEAISKLKKSGIENVYELNVLTEEDRLEKIIQESFGENKYTILLPEVLEHIPNPVDFLSTIVKGQRGRECKIVISVPNAYGFGHVCDALFHNCENINMDHKYMFTPTTILKTMFVSGIIPQKIEFLDLYKYSKIFRKPILGNTIVVVGKMGNSKA